MELDERKRRVLSVIAEVYTQTGEPVGSKLIAMRLNSAYSPATIRNDMAALFDLGLLEQPHTSAGRILSHLGYRVYVDDLMKLKPVSGTLRDNIEAMFNIRDPDPDKLLEDAAKALAEITGCAVFTTALTPDDAVVQRIELIPSGEHAVVMLVIASNGVVRSKVCRTSFQVTEQLLNFLRAFCRSRLVGVSLRDISQQYLNMVTVELGEYSRIFVPLFAALFELCTEIYEGQYSCAGATNLLRYTASAQESHELLSFVERRENVMRLLEHCRGAQTSVSIGKENQQAELQNSSVLISRYQVGRKGAGAIGLIGPIRMDYAAMISELEYFARLMGELLTEIFEDRQQRDSGGD